MAIFKGDKKIADVLPNINDASSGKFLTNDGTELKWESVPVEDIQISGSSIVSEGIANITSSNLPDIPLSKVSDVTATAAEVNVLDGITASTLELNFVDGVTSNIQTQLDSKQATLVSGSNIKTINNSTILGSGNLNIDSLPSLTGKSGRYLKTNGTAASWEPTLLVDATFGTDDKLVFTGDVGGVTVVQTTGTSISDVMSQKATTDAISLNSATNLISSPAACMPTGSSITFESVDTYTFDDIFLISWLPRYVCCGRSMAMKMCNIITLRKNVTTYLEFKYNSYSIQIRNILNSTILNTYTFNFSASSEPINANLSEYGELDLDAKRIRLVKYIDNVETEIINLDITDWDLTHLDSFNIVTGAGTYENPIACVNVRLNYRYDYISMMQEKMRWAEYNTWEQTSYKPDIRLSNTYVTVTGTKSLDETHHKISAVTSTGGYTGLGVNSSLHSSKSCLYSFRLKILDGTCSMKNGAGVESIMLYNTSGNLVKKLDGSYYTLTNDTEYIAYCSVGKTSSLGYCASYGFNINGTFTIEVWDDRAYYSTSQNICSETFNGTYISGSIPFSTSSMRLSVPTLTERTPALPHEMPYLASIVDSSGNIKMWNGSAWKQINNS